MSSTERRTIIDEYEDEESDGLILSIGEDGKASIHKPEDYVEMHKDDVELLKGFIDKYKDLFKKYVDECQCKKHER